MIKRQRNVYSERLRRRIVVSKPPKPQSEKVAKLGSSHHEIIQSTISRPRMEQNITWKEKEEYKRASQARERSRYPEERYNARMSTSVLQKRQASSQSRSYYRAVVRSPRTDIDNGLSSVRSQSRNFEKGIPLPEPVPSLPTEALQQARKEVHDAMLQYTRVADPLEREAREERMRLAEDLGEMEETATNMVQAAMHLSAEKHGRIQITDTPERIPAVQRLSVPESHECIPTSARLGPCPLVQEPVQRTIPPNGDIVNAERVPASLRLDYPPETVLPPTTTGSTVKRKPGRPPGPKKGNESSGAKPPLAAAASSKIRRVPAGKPSPIRRSTKAAKAKSGAGPSKGKNQPGARSDTAWSETTKNAGLGWTVTSREQRTMLKKGIGFTPSALVAEGLGLTEAVATYNFHGVKEALFEPDSSQLISAVNGDNPPLELYGIVEDIHIIASAF
ncbi:LOW QUALITY PROTEIN: hypothetical protein HID58_058073 [Brassica napus]|uniref:RNase H type-1 domain-containing protein n=1 Tax=Brassica napus TaxID=3708 RepID=A0ABQ7ZPJ2_BRANA|nr:LOW QUALITY PROTEIN: hypothetical protein HID58_058073 [Brassica napus]